MVLSMSEEIKTLVIVEGEKGEPAFCKSIEAAYSLNFSICCLGTNIYSLYKKLEEYDFNADIKKILVELHPEYEEILSQKFAYTYLFFDLDPHHTKKDELRTVEQIICENIEKIKEMATFFNDETDPTIGRLYINYPMLESYRDCDVPFDPNYQDEYVQIADIGLFKQHVGKKKMASKHLDKYTENDYNELTKMNVYKLNKIMNQHWDVMKYEDYLAASPALNILGYQTQIVSNEKKIAVLNTSLFFLLDFFGNQSGFYDKVMSLQ